MQYETKKDRLKIYQKMLKDYNISNIPIIGFLFSLKQAFNTKYGFCWYLYKSTNNKYFIEDLIELNKLQPINKYNNIYWFKEGELKPRIELLKKAISDTKMHIEIERLMLEK